MCVYSQGSCKRTKGAFSLIEAAIVLAVVGLVIGAIWVASATVIQKMRVRQIYDGMLFIAQRLNEVHGRGPIKPVGGAGAYIMTYRGTWRNPVVGQVVYPDDLVRLIGTLPPGWTVKSNTLYGPGTGGTAFIFVWGDPAAANELGWTIDIPVVFTNASDCRAFGALALAGLKGSNIVYAGVGGTGSTYVESQLNNGNWNWYKTGGVSGSGIAEAIQVGQVVGCNNGNLMISRP